MITKTNQVKMFHATTISGDYKLSANIKVDLSDNLLSIDSGIITPVVESGASISLVDGNGTFYLYEAGSINVSVSQRANLEHYSALVAEFINQLTQSK